MFRNFIRNTVDTIENQHYFLAYFIAHHINV